MNASLKVLRILLFIVLALTGLSSLRYSAFELAEGELRLMDRWHVNDQFNLISQPQRAMVVGEEMCIHLVEGKVELWQCAPSLGEVVWESPDDWQVQEAFFSDLNHDSVPELTMLAWRPFMPWPVDRFMPHSGRIDAFQDEDGLSCHLILIRLGDGKPRDLWVGSALADPLHSLIADDLDGDGQQELAAIEYPYDSKTSSGAAVIWRWNGFGFSLVDREEGNYKSIFTADVGSSVVILLQKD